MAVIKVSHDQMKAVACTYGKTKKGQAIQEYCKNQGKTHQIDLFVDVKIMLKVSSRSSL
jgi:hypothetical protein